MIYPGSVERTSFAERFETKGFALLRFRGGRDGGRLVARRFVPLRARPMHVVEVDVAGRHASDIEGALRRRFAAIEPDAVVRVVAVGTPDPSAARALSAPVLRALAPATMNVELARPARERARGEHRAAR